MKKSSKHKMGGSGERWLFDMLAKMDKITNIEPEK